MYSCGIAKFDTHNKCSLTQINKIKTINFIHEWLDQKVYPEKEKLKTEDQ